MIQTVYEHQCIKQFVTLLRNEDESVEQTSDRFRFFKPSSLDQPFNVSPVHCSQKCSKASAEFITVCLYDTT